MHQLLLYQGHSERSCQNAVQCLQESVHGLREQVRLLRSQRQRDVVLANLPPLRPEVQQQSKVQGDAKCMALTMLHRLQLEPSQTPKVTCPWIIGSWCIEASGYQSCKSDQAMTNKDVTTGASFVSKTCITEHHLARFEQVYR